MKNTIKLILLIVAVMQLNPASAQRNTLWMRGVSQNSNGWNGTKRTMEFMGYDFRDRLLSTYQPGLGVEAAADVLAGTFGGNDDILGIAHDYGGLVMRDLQLKDDNISAMVLVGVPNQGSAAIEFTTTVEQGSDGTRAQKLVDAIQDLKAGNSCEDCDLVGAFDSWVNGLYGGRNYLSDATPHSPVIAHLNDNMPTIPFAVMWGSVKEFSITRLLSSRAFPSDGDHYTQCYAKALEDARQQAKDAFLIATIRNTAGLLGGVMNFIGAITPNLSASEWTTRIGNFINTQRQNFIAGIQAVKERDEELARILRCEFANQLLAAEWQLALLEHSDLDTHTIQVPVPSEYDDCVLQCGIDMAWGDFGMDVTCEEFCFGLPDNEIIDATVFIVEENDGLLTKSEQLLDGAAKTYHLEETNHFQESRADVKQVVSDAFEDLFEGGAGAAFIVPKQ